MRQFILGAADVAYATGATPELAASGAVGFYYLKDGKLTVSAKGAEMKGEGAIVLGRTSAEGGPVILPFYNNHFSFVKSSYKTAKTFVAEFTIPDVTVMEDHSVIFVKKGIQFNERANWTATVHAYKTSETVDMVAKKIADYVNNNPLLGLTAVASAAKVTVTATKPGVDYELVPADALFGMEITYTTRGEAALNDAEGIKKLADMAAADAGLNIRIVIRICIFILIILLILLLSLRKLIMDLRYLLCVLPFLVQQRLVTKLFIKLCRLLFLIKVQV